MNKDSGPRYNLGYGLQGSDNSNINRSANPESGFIAKKLHDHPVMKFFAVGASSMVAAAVAGGVVKKGGLKLGFEILEAAEKSSPEAVSRFSEVFRTMQKTLDEYGGVVTKFAEGNEEQKLIFKDAKGKIRAGTKTFDNSTGFFFTQRETEEALRTGQEVPAQWTIKREIQKRLVSQARRMPYELPALYVANDVLINPLLNEDTGKRKVNWANPLDVTTDFIASSAKSALTMLMPFEAAAGAATGAKNSFLTYGDNFVAQTAKQQFGRDLSIATKVLSGQIGEDIAKVFNTASRTSAQITGSFSAAIDAAQNDPTYYKQYYKQLKNDIRTKNSAVDPSTLRSRIKNTFSTLVDPKTGTIDQLPGPFGGLGSGIKAGRDRWAEIGKGYSAFDQMMLLGKGSLDDDSFIAMQSVLGGGSDLEDLASNIQSLTRSRKYKRGTFFEGQKETEYSKMLQRRLVNGYGINSDAADQFMAIAKIVPPGKKYSSDIAETARRIHFGNNDILHTSTGSAFNDELMARMGMIDSVHARKIADSLTGAMKDVDQLFSNKMFQNSLNKKIEQSLKFTEDTIVPQFAHGILPQAKVPYHSFSGDLTYQQQNFLIRKTASVLGMGMRDEHGEWIKDAVLQQNFHKFGIGGNDFNQMIGFLTTKNHISKPWSIGGANLFGFSPLTANAAIQKGYFKNSEADNAQLKSLLDKIKQNDPVSRNAGEYTVKGVYQTQSGRIVDLSQLQRRGQKFLHALSQDFQIPIVGIKPFETAGSKYWHAKQDRNAIQYIPGHIRQPFVGKAQQSAENDFYLWMQDGTRGHRGRIHAVKSDGGVITSTQLEGRYVAGDTGQYKIGARHARLAMGESGHVNRNATGPISDRESKIAKIKELFSYNPNQERSIGNFARRFAGRRSDIRNPYIMAKLLNEGEISVGKNLFTLDAELNYLKNGEIIMKREAVAKAFNNDFANTYLRNFGITPRAMKALEKDSAFEDLFSFDFTGMKPTTFKEGKVKLSDLRSEDQIKEAMKLMARKHSEMSDALSSDAARALKRSDSGFLYSHLNRPSGPSSMDQTVAQSARSNTINTRLDLAKADLINGNIMANAIIGGYDDFSSVLPNVGRKLLDLKVKGVISQSEYSESMTALLSLQVNYSSFKNFKAADGRMGDITKVMKDLIRNPEARASLDEIMSGRVGAHGGGVQGILTPSFRRNMSVSSYQFEGSAYNPFGGTNTVFIPDYATASARNPTAAFKSAMGFGTWNNPDAFSAAGIPMGHMFERLNRFGNVFSMGLNTDHFNGPMDFYARGIVAKRALPLVAGATTFMALDRTAGSIVGGRDENGEKQYKPLITGALAKGVVYAQATASGIMPGGKGFKDKREEILHGEVAIRAGRYFPLGNTPWVGGKIKYFSPSWYRKFTSGYSYNSEGYGSPLERLAFGHDFSPLKPFDPYHYEKKHYADRPYPITGDYFTGPWGPITGILNSTIGKVLKPARQMHQDEVQAGLAAYQPYGESGAVYRPIGGGSPSGLGYSSSSNVAGQGSATGVLAQSNVEASRGTYGTTNTASGSTAAFASIAAENNSRSRSVGGPKRTPLPVSPTVVAGTGVINQSSLRYQAGMVGYNAQELFGIYGFAFGSAREALGLGSRDFSPHQPVLQSATKMTSSTRGFWDLNIGGLGDAPLSIEGDLGNLELSEIVRRFVPKERSDVDYVNPISNTMGVKHPWLPGANYFTDFKTGDPFTSVEIGEARLPGKGYQKLNRMYADGTGDYGIVDRLKILGDIAPYSDEYKAALAEAKTSRLPADYKMRVNEIQRQVELKKVKHTFVGYKYKYKSADELGISPLERELGVFGEKVSHLNSILNTKFLPHATAVEDWERNNVYGATFPEWQHPIKDFIGPMVHSASQRNPLVAAAVLGTAGSLFSTSAKGRAIGAVGGGLIGFLSSSITKSRELVSGQRYMPINRKKEVALEENIDILTYVKNKALAEKAQQQGNVDAAATFEQAAKNTMYGADIRSGNIDQLAQALPERKRDYFKNMVYAPIEERSRILSTAGVLERRFYQAAWGNSVEARPDLGDYFKNHELPSADSEFWTENTSMEYVKIKMGQSMGLDMSEMGYYPQQIKEANLVNPAYPSFSGGSSNAQHDLQRIMDARGIKGRIIKTHNAFGRDTVSINAGVL